MPVTLISLISTGSCLTRVDLAQSKKCVNPANAPFSFVISSLKLACIYAMSPLGFLTYQLVLQHFFSIPLFKLHLIATCPCSDDFPWCSLHHSVASLELTTNIGQILVSRPHRFRHSCGLHVQAFWNLKLSFLIHFCILSKSYH